jgi:uncharacterized protein (UPF0335 family)
MMPRAKLTTPESDAQFRAAVAETITKTLKDTIDATITFPDGATVAHSNAGAQERLRALVDRIERLEAEKAEVAEQVKEVYAEAKGEGFAVKVLRLVVRRRRRRREEVREEDETVRLYEDQLET